MGQRAASITGQKLNWTSARLQNGRLQVRILPDLPHQDPVAKWQGSCLQSIYRQFDPDRGLQQAGLV